MSDSKARNGILMRHSVASARRAFDREPPQALNCSTFNTPCRPLGTGASDLRNRARGCSSCCVNANRHRRVRAPGLEPLVSCSRARQCTADLDHSRCGHCRVGAHAPTRLARRRIGGGEAVARDLPSAFDLLEHEQLLHVYAQTKSFTPVRIRTTLSAPT